MIKDEKKIENWSIDQMLEIQLNDPDDFLRIKETLTRIGISSKREHNTLYQSCHILHKQGRYFLVHFKEMFMLDGKESSITDVDIARRNTITMLLSDWGLLDILKPESIGDTVPVNSIKILPFREKKVWTLEAKYTIGISKNHYS